MNSILYVFDSRLLGFETNLCLIPTNMNLGRIRLDTHAYPLSQTTFTERISMLKLGTDTVIRPEDVGLRAFLSTSLITKFW